MRKKLICLVVLGALPGLAMADTTSDEVRSLEAELHALQKEVKQLRAQQTVAQSGKNTSAPAVQPAAVDESSTDYGSAVAHLTNDDLDQIKQQISNQQLKVDSLTDAASTGPLAGLSITGYLDPTYIYNHGLGTSSFLFANHANEYEYYNSSFGDLYLDIKKKFGVGPLAPSAEVTLMPNRGNGITQLMNEHGSSSSDLLNTAVITVPFSMTTSLVAGLMPSFGGYEVQQSNQMLTLTHGLLYDFSDPGSYVGVGLNYTGEGSNWAWKFMLGNEQFRTSGAQIQTGTNGLGDPISTSNKVPTFTARVDYTWSSALDLGGSLNIGRQTLSQGVGPNGSPIPSYGPGGAASSPFGTFLFTEADATYQTADVQYNAEFDFGQQQHAAWNGGTAQWYGLSLLANRKFHVPGLGRMGVTARYDVLADQKNGGGASSIVLNGNGMDPYNGWGVGASCLKASRASGGYGFECKGAVRQDVAFDLLFYPTQYMTIKMEYRHDWSTQDTFLRNDGSYGKSNVRGL